MLGDVELRENLDAADDAGGVALGDPLDLVHDAVHPKARDERVTLGQEVQVARAVLDRLDDDRVDEPDRRSVGGAVGVEIGVLLERAGEHVLDHRGALADLVCAGEQAQLEIDVERRRDREVERVVADEAQLVDGRDLARIGDRDLQPAVDDAIGDRAGANEEIEREHLRCQAVDLGGTQVDEVQRVATGARVRWRAPQESYRSYRRRGRRPDSRFRGTGVLF